MVEKPNGGPAFPCTMGPDGGVIFNGMSLRDCFAIVMMHAILIRYGATDNQDGAYRIADKMLKERDK